MAHALQLHFVNTAADDTRRTLVTRDIAQLQPHDDDYIVLGDIPLELQDGELSSVDIVLDDDKATDIDFTIRAHNHTIHTLATAPPFSPLTHNGTELVSSQPAFLAFDTTYTITALLYTTPDGETPFSLSNLRQTLLLNFTIVQHSARSSPIHQGQPSLSRVPVKPNIVLILADDLAWSFTSVEMRQGQKNSKSPINGFVTANLERMAQEGTVFSRAYSCGPQCSPARACIITGQTAARNRLTVSGGFKRQDPFQHETYRKYGESPMIGVMSQELDGQQLSLPQALELQGYKSAIPVSN